MPVQSGDLHLSGSASVLLNPQFVIYAATREFITEPTDALANQPFFGTLQKALRFDRSIMSSGGFGQVTVGWGELELINTEADYDFVISDYAIDGRRIVVRVGNYGASYDSFFTLLDCMAEDWHVEEDVVRIRLRDNSFMLDTPAQPHVYAGTGDLEGGNDLAGKRVPRAWGHVDNISPPLVIPAELLYQVNDGEIDQIDAVYDNGIALTAASPTADYATAALLRAASTGAFGSGEAIEAGEYATCLAEGLVRLGGTPVGRVTMDIMGMVFDGDFIDTHADVIYSLVSANGTVPVTVNEASFDAVNAAQPAPIGYYLGEEDNRSVADVIADLATSMGGWAGFKRDGSFEVGIFADPTGVVPTARYEAIDIVENEIRRERVPAEFSPPPFRYRVMWGRNWTVQDDLAASADAARVAYLREPFRLARSNEGDEITILTDHPLARDPDPIESYYRNEVDAEAEANRLLALFGLEVRSLYRITIKSHPFVHDVGEVIHLTYDRWDLSEGRLLRLVEIVDDTDNNTVELMGYG